MFHLSRKRLAVLVLPAVAALALNACSEQAATDESAGAADPDTLVFAAVPSEEATSLQADYQAVIDMLEQETGKTIEFQQATDYAAIIEGQRAGKIDIAQYGPFSYVLARTSGVETTPVGATVEKPGEMPGYRSFGIATADSPVNGLADYRGKTVCFVDPASTSGYLYPTAGLIEAGIDPKTDITPVMAGGHDASALAVASGQCDAGFAFDTMVTTQLIESGQLQPGQLKTVWESEVIAGSPLAISNDLSSELSDQITAAIHEKANVDYLKANGFCGDDCIVGEEGEWGFVAVDDSLYDGVREVCATTNDEQCKS